MAKGIIVPIYVLDRLFITSKVYQGKKHHGPFSKKKKTLMWISLQERVTGSRRNSVLLMSLTQMPCFIGTPMMANL